MKIALLTSTGLSEFNVNTLKPILEDKLFSIELAIIDARPRKSFTQRLKKNIKRGRGGYMLIMFFKNYFSQRQKKTATKEFCYEYGIDVLETKDPYSAQTIEMIKNHKLDILVLIDGYGFIKEPLLSVAPLGILSYHHGNMRKYRGMPPALWELYNNEPEMGVTVQILTSGLDAGIPIEEKTIKIEKNDTLKSLKSRAFSASVDMMHRALRKLSDPCFVPVKIETPGKIYTLPNLRQWLLFQLKLIGRKMIRY